MRRILVFVSLLLTVVLALSGVVSAQAPSEDYGRLIVKPKQGVPEAARVAAERALGLTREARVLDGTVEILEVSGGAGKGKAAAAALAKTGRYEYVEPDILIPMAAAAPDDPDFGLQWGLKNTQHPGIDINALAAWDISQGAGAVIAVLDSGERHLYDLAQTRWTNPGETANGLDDDGNGFVDDLYGWNYWHGTNDISQGDPMHGTHVGGIAAAVTNNGTGVAGVAPQAKRMILKICDGTGCYISMAVKATDYARQKGAKVINASWGGFFTSQALRDAVVAYTSGGGIFVAAAGNDGENHDTYTLNGHYSCPDCYARDVPGVIAVAAIKGRNVVTPGELASWSSYGPQTVLLAAPGENIYSTLPDGSYGNASGTSMAAPHVTGVVALMFSAKPDATVGEITNALHASAKPRTSLTNTVSSGGMLDAYGALSYLASDTTPPAVAVSPAGGAYNTEQLVTLTANEPAQIYYTVDGTDPTDSSPLYTGAITISAGVYGSATTTLKFMAVDLAGNRSAARTVTYTIDATAPVLLLPAGMSVEATSPAGAAVTYSATATDDTDPGPAVVCTPASGSTFPLGVTAATCSATDTAGNSASGSFTVTVGDTTPPVLLLPSNVTAEATSSAGAAVTYSASATDAAAGNVPVACTPGSGSTFPFGVTTVTCSATDNYGNTATGSFTVTVADRTAPALTLPTNITVEATSATGAAVTYSASATDAVAGNVPVACMPGSGSTFPIGTTTVTCSATDNYGNAATGSFTITVVADTTAPGEVLNLTAQAGNRSVTLTWTDPGDSDLAKILVSWWGGSQEVAPGTQTLTVTGLKNGTSYEFQVRSADIAGNVSAGTAVKAVPGGTGGSDGGGGKGKK